MGGLKKLWAASLPTIRFVATQHLLLPVKERITKCIFFCKPMKVKGMVFSKTDVGNDNKNAAQEDR